MQMIGFRFTEQFRCKLTAFEDVKVNWNYLISLETPLYNCFSHTVRLHKVELFCRAPTGSHCKYFFTVSPLI